MWPEIFTHDYENGTKVAIILLDTQGIFDSKSSIHDCTTIFALSTLLSSVQCCNIIRSVDENDLQNLRLFTEYAQLATDADTRNLFQNLMFIVRDWPYDEERNYGPSKEYIDYLLDENNNQTPEMRELRKRIKSSFEKISSFLMPNPGPKITQGTKSTGKLDDILPEFKQYLKILIPSILAPEALVIKQINGYNIRAHELIRYIDSYNKIFIDDKLPKAQDIFTVFIDIVKCHIMLL